MYSHPLVYCTICCTLYNLHCIICSLYLASICIITQEDGCKLKAMKLQDDLRVVTVKVPFQKLCAAAEEVKIYLPSNFSSESEVSLLQKQLVMKTMYKGPRIQ